MYGGLYQHTRVVLYIYSISGLTNNGATKEVKSALAEHKKRRHYCCAVGTSDLPHSSE